ncbi:hypothetical protein [Kaistella jeonii]|uniref:Type VI secretion system baseplate subunit TssK n=1 Tax=Kaistella jeonii TaxID=266749 RepID=A0A0C1CN74_9FLAO|nr:hypothetical protein [Kaistella jeonii]KIA85481.1 hypothetical protein OA86_14655 [Kaistella jeonii]SFC42008.1 hypothetical protein SAMN05421876_12023 [Kaistella jeonii]VEI97343.1 Uncharacterised protein [Kaistella jeonii]
MIEPIKHYAVNWVDGMKISREHLIQQENFIIDAIRDANSVKINAFNYGLLPFSDSYGDKRIFEIQSTATNDAQLIIKKLSAVTFAGHRIEVNDFKVNIRSLAKDLNTEDNESNGDYYILASVNPFDKISFGEINSEEIPPRHPFTKANSKIELVDTALLLSGYSGGNFIILGKVAIKSGIAQIDEHFIPPCTSVEAHPKLVEYYNQYSHSMSNLRVYAFKILQKVAHKNQNDELANNVKKICKTIVNHISENYFEFKNMVYNEPPIYMMNVFSKLALHLYNDTQMMIPAELEEMLNYSLEWSEVAPHTLLNQLSSVAEIDYVHHDTGEIFHNTQIMLKSLEQVLGKLSELDYIGQRKENVIVNEQQVKSTNDPKKGWSVLD